MAGEIQVSFATGQTLGFLVRNQSAQPWSNSGAGGFGPYLTPSYADYVNSMVEQGTASAYYAGTFPPAIPPGSYNIVAKKQQGGSPLETDPTIAVGDVEWDGANIIPLAALASSGQVSQIAPIRMARGVMVRNFPFKLVSSADNRTPFTSGVVSGQISRDGGAFGPLQSGAFSEIGLGWYALQALTSGDLLGNTAALVLTANGISGGQAAPRDFGFILQKSSGVQ